MICRIQLPITDRPIRSRNSDEDVRIGTGLTAADAVVTAFRRYPTAQVTAISRHGEFPLRFEFTSLSSADMAELPYSCSRDAMKWIRTQAAHHGWDATFSFMRPHWETIWRHSSSQQRKQFQRHLSHRFNRLRHRMPQATADIIATRLASKQLTVRVGTVLSANEKVVRLTPPTNDEIKADLVIDCSGHSIDWNSKNDPLATYLVDRGIVTRDSLVTNENGQVLVPDGIDCPLYAIGPILRGERLETTAVPELREQIRRVAESILNRGKEQSP